MKLKKKIFLTGTVSAETGLHIGGTNMGMSIGGADSPVIRDPVTNVPYIPGSSLKGKMRSLLEKATAGVDIEHQVASGIKIHQCSRETNKEDVCMICKVFGLPAEHDGATPARLLVRDARMTDEWAKKLEESKNTDMPYTEVKTEVVIDRVTSAANPRQIERVPAGAIFGLEMVVNIFEGDDESEILDTIDQGIRLIEDDYLGGSGTRGYGKVTIDIASRTYKDEPIYAGDNKAAPLGD